VQDLYDVHMLDADLGWAVGSYDALLRSVDGGVSWSRGNSGLGNTPGQIGIILYNWCVRVLSRIGSFRFIKPTRASFEPGLAATQARGELRERHTRVGRGQQRADSAFVRRRRDVRAAAERAELRHGAQGRGASGLWVPCADRCMHAVRIGSEADVNHDAVQVSVGGGVVFACGDRGYVVKTVDAGARCDAGWG
jgi:hypothetical protein